MDKAKMWAALIGAAITAAVGVIGGDSTAGKILTAVAALATTFAVYQVPNRPNPEA